MNTDTVIKAELLAGQSAFMSAFADERAMEQFALHWQAITQRAARALEEGALSHETALLFSLVLRRVHVVTSSLTRREEHARITSNAVVSKAQAVLGRQGSSTFLPNATSRTPLPHTKRPSPPAPEHDALLAPYRRWFLDNFAYPYLNPATKTALVLAVPSQSASQASTWAINSRRRSGWGELYKRYGGENKEMMAQFMRQVDSPTMSWQVSEEARRDVEKCREWFRDHERDQVREGIAEVVARAAEERRAAPTKKPVKTSKKPPTNLGILPSLPVKQEAPSADIVVSPLTPRNFSNTSSNDSSSRNFSGLSHFSVDSSSTSASSYYSASPISFDPSTLVEFPLPLLPTLPSPTAEQQQSAFIYPTPAQAQEPNPYFSTLADFPYSTMNPVLAQRSVSFS